MRQLALAVFFVAAAALSGRAIAQDQQPASADGKSVPMQQAPSKIHPGKSKAERHHAKR